LSQSDSPIVIDTFSIFFSNFYSQWLEDVTMWGEIDGKPAPFV
jgi:hypothetical protein